MADVLSWIDEELRNIQDQNLFRYLTEISSGQYPEVTIEGKKYILFASNSYLGLSVHPEIIKESRKVLEEYGVGSGGSRLVSGSTDLHRKLEERIAEFKKTDSAILFSSGYLANVGLISAVVGMGDFIYSDELNHASIIDGCRLSKANIRKYRHLDYEHLESLLREDEPKKGKRLIVTDSVFSMDGDLADLSVLADLSERFGCMLMVDEAHATGVLGKRGSGATEYFGVEDRVPLVMGTLSKAIGSIGGYIAGSKKLTDFIRNRVRSYIFDTSLPPPSVAASLKAIEIIERDEDRRKHLWKLIRMFKEGMTSIGYHVVNSNSAIIPILTGDPITTLALASYLKDHGIYTPAVRPPSVPPGKCRIRVSLMASHTEDHIGRALHVFKSAYKDLRLTSKM